MASALAKTFTTPVGRLVGGSLYVPSTTDLEGNPLLFKSGEKKGQPGRVEYYFQLAVPKSVNPHWASDEWGAVIWGVGHAAVANAGQRQFSWKISDGDNATADDKGRRPCDRPGYAGHWILHLSTGYPTKVFKQRPGTGVNGTKPEFDPYTVADAVKLGYWVQVQITTDYNGSSAQPGVYLNHNMVCFSAFGDEISIGGADPSSAGFGAAPLPAGASLTPPANFVPPAAPAPLVPGLPPAPPGAAMPPPPAPVAAMPPPPAPPAPVAPVAIAATPVMVQGPNAQYTVEQCRGAGWTDAQIIAAGHGVLSAPAPVPAPLPLAGFAPPPPPPALIANVPPPAVVTPNPAFLQVPGAPPPPAARVMLPAAQGISYEQYKANGWTDAQLIQNGMMAA